MKDYRVYFWADQKANEKLVSDLNLPIKHNDFNKLNPEQILLLSGFFDVMISTGKNDDKILFLDTKGKRFSQR